MRIRLTLSFVLSLGFLLSPSASAETALGNGFRCEGSSILKGSRTIPYSKAKSNVATTLRKLKDKLAVAPKKKKAGIKAQIAAANNARTLLMACSDGKLAADQVDPIFTQLAANGGTFEGNYSGTVNGFLPIGGTIAFQFLLEQTTFSTVLTLGGSLGAALDAQPLTFSADVGGIGFPAKFELPDTFLGQVTLSVSQDGKLNIVNSGSPNAQVVFDGQFTANNITGSLDGTYKGNTFQGSGSLNRK